MNLERTLKYVPDEEVVEDCKSHVHIRSVVPVITQHEAIHQFQQYEEDHNYESYNEHNAHVLDQALLTEIRSS